jgi:hypothetical protein
LIPRIVGDEGKWRKRGKYGERRREIEREDSPH